MAQLTQKVCIIGAGPNGLMSARHIAECPNTEVTIFEANSGVGGLWLYDEKNNADPKFEEEKKQDTYYQLYNQFHASLYPNLQSNLPYFFMSFKDLSHADIIKEVPSFIDIAQHKAYLNAYADKFNLKNKVIFNTLVKSVRLYDNLSPEQQSLVPEKRKFAVTTANARGGDLEAGVRVHAFDYVLICTGCNVIPYIPPVKGMEKFKGKVLTVKSFREPNTELFMNKKLMVLGAAMSAIDMIIQFFEDGSQNVEHMTLVGRDVKVMQKNKDFAQYRENCKLSIFQGEIKEITGPNTIKLTDESEHEIDTLLFCTGYELSFPFLDFEKDKIIDHPKESFCGRFIAPLYKRLVSIREPSLFFMGFIGTTPLATLCFEAQGLFVKAIIEGKYKLPSQNEMLQSFLNDKDDLQWNHKKTLDWYFKLIPFAVDLKYLEGIKSILRKIYNHNEEKAQEFNNGVMDTYKQMGEFFCEANAISYKKFDFHRTFGRTLRDTTEFI